LLLQEAKIQIRKPRLIMKKNFTEDSFEDFLRQSADGLRMRASDKVWKGISGRMNKNRRRGVFAVGSFLLALFTFSYFIIDQSARKFNAFAEPQAVAKDGTPGIDNKNTSTEKESTPGLALPGTTDRPFTNARSPLYVVRDEATPGSSVLTVSDLASSNTAGTTDASLSQSPAAAFAGTIIDESFDTEEKEAAAAETKDQATAVLPLTIESVTNSYRPKKAKKSLQWETYFTPTVSYRRLSENKSFLLSQQQSSSPSLSAATQFDVNNVVNHAPSFGFEIGMAARYPLTSRLNLRAGLQLNLNRYSIQAYDANSSVATIMLNTDANRVDSVNRVTTISNTNGYQPKAIENFYFQVSAPIGVEYKFVNTPKIRFGVATTIQPTYVLNDKAHVISTDYKNYAEAPDMVRRWNVNTSFETFVGYSTGRLNWQVGPQVRYQLLSSFITRYPIKENLIGYGLRIGISMNK
jgi:hypothetical protein